QALTPPGELPHDGYPLGTGAASLADARGGGRAGGNAGRRNDPTLAAGRAPSPGGSSGAAPGTLGVPRSRCRSHLRRTLPAPGVWAGSAGGAGPAPLPAVAVAIGGPVRLSAASGPTLPCAPVPRRRRIVGRLPPPRRARRRGARPGLPGTPAFPGRPPGRPQA